MSNRDIPESQQITPPQGINLAYSIANIYAGCVTPFTRKEFGSRAFRVYPASGMLMFFFGGFANCHLLIQYLPYWLGMVAFRRITYGRNQHSLYQGRPWMGKDIKVGQLLEVLLCFGLGAYLAGASQPLSKFVMGIPVALLTMMWIEHAAERGRAIALKDAEVAARHMQQLSRKVRKGM